MATLTEAWPKATVADSIKELERELAVRRAVYPKWMQTGRIKAATAEKQVAALECAVNNLRDLENIAAVLRTPAFTAAAAKLTPEQRKRLIIPPFHKAE